MHGLKYFFYMLLRSNSYAVELCVGVLSTAVVIANTQSEEGHGFLSWKIHRCFFIRVFVWVGLWPLSAYSYSCPVGAEQKGFVKG